MSALPPPAAASQRRTHTGLKIELDVTPRWFAVPPPDRYDARILHEDAAAIHGALAVSESVARLLTVDASIGTTGVRLVLEVPAEQPTDGFEAERLAIKATLDALDGYHPRRRRVTEARAQMEATRLQQEAARLEEAQRAVQAQAEAAKQQNGAAAVVETPTTDAAPVADA